jgi:arylformamidase
VVLEITDTTTPRPALTSRHAHTQRLWDISPPVHEGAPVFPGDTPYQQRWAATISPGCPVNVSEITLSPHIGAHADAPLHYDPEGQLIGHVDLAPFLGPCRVIHAIAKGPLIEWEHIAHAVTATCRRACWCAPTPPHAGGPLGPAAGGLRARHRRAPRRHGREAHRHRHRQHRPGRQQDAGQPPTHPPPGLRVLENLVLDDVPEGDYELIALPLKLVSADASPVRAVLRELPRPLKPPP